MRVHLCSVLWQSKIDIREKVLEFVHLSHDMITPESLTGFPSVHSLLHLIGHLFHHHIQMSTRTCLHSHASTTMKDSATCQMNTLRSINLLNIKFLGIKTIIVLCSGASSPENLMNDLSLAMHAHSLECFKSILEKIFFTIRSRFRL